MIPDNKSLIFVYNSDSLPLPQALDFLYRISMPHAYQCQLTVLTKGLIFPKPAWTSFISSLPIKSKFRYRDDILKKYPDKKNFFPCIFIEDSIGIQLFLNKDEINSCSTVEQLINLIKSNLSTVPPV